MLVGVLNKSFILSHGSPSKIEYKQSFGVNLNLASMPVKVLENNYNTAARLIRYDKDPGSIKQIKSELQMNRFKF